MNKTKHLLKNLKYWFETKSLLRPDIQYILDEFGAHHCSESQQKFASLIVMQTHVIEKGLSLKEVKPGYGVPKILNLLKDIEKYYSIYHDIKVPTFALSVIDAYIKYNKKMGVENSEIISKYNHLRETIPSSDQFSYLNGGGIALTRQEIQKDASIDYLRFVKSRHSIRNFTGKPINPELIKRALEMAAYTPSACNRQPWHNHIFTKKEHIIKVLDLQTGARQFKEDVGAIIIISSSANHFFGNEHNQLYLNGGMYAMNLLLALHSLGLGAIPLNMGISNDKLKAIKECCKIPESEMPVLLIAIGEIAEELTVAASRRFDYMDYSTFDI